MQEGYVSGVQLEFHWFVLNMHQINEFIKHAICRYAIKTAGTVQYYFNLISINNPNRLYISNSTLKFCQTNGPHGSICVIYFVESYIQRIFNLSNYIFLIWFIWIYILLPLWGNYSISTVLKSPISNENGELFKSSLFGIIIQQFWGTIKWCPTLLRTTHFLEVHKLISELNKMCSVEGCLGTMWRCPRPPNKFSLPIFWPIFVFVQEIMSFEQIFFKFSNFSHRDKSIILKNLTQN